MRRTALALAATVAALALSPALAAAASCPRASLPDVEDEVMCVVCGTALSVSQSPQADRERAFIRQRIAACDTKAQIKDELVTQYGRSVLATPGGGGFDVTSWLVPLLAVLAAAGALAFAVPRWRRARAPGSAPEAPALSSAESRRLDEDIARYDL
jgi:cytochrome c-type biogenesis protein CcmH